MTCTGHPIGSTSGFVLWIQHRSFNFNKLVESKPSTRHLIGVFLITALCTAIITIVVFQSKSSKVPETTQARSNDAGDNVGLQGTNSTDTKLTEPSIDELIDEYVKQMQREDPNTYHLDNGFASFLVNNISMTIPSYAMDESGNIPEWVLKGPDMFDEVRRTRLASNNTATNRFMWYAHMNRLDETQSLYIQLNITQCDIDSQEFWVDVAINTAKQIRRRIMQYFVFYAPEFATCDLSSWEAIRHEAPDAVQHRMRVFIAKLEYLRPFDRLRQFTQDDSEYLPLVGLFREYFRYQSYFETWNQTNHDIAEEVHQLSFQGCTRVFELVSDLDAALKKIVDLLDEAIQILTTNPDLADVIEGFNLIEDSCGPGYDMFDRLPEPIQQRLQKLAEMRIEKLAYLINCSQDMKAGVFGTELHTDPPTRDFWLSKLQETQTWFREILSIEPHFLLKDDAFRTVLESDRSVITLWNPPERAWIVYTKRGMDEVYAATFIKTGAKTGYLPIRLVMNFYKEYRYLFEVPSDEPAPGEEYPQWILDAAEASKVAASGKDDENDQATNERIETLERELVLLKKILQQKLRVMQLIFGVKLPDNNAVGNRTEPTSSSSSEPVS